MSVVAGAAAEAEFVNMSFGACAPARTLGPVTLRANEQTTADFTQGEHSPCALRGVVTVNGLPVKDYSVTADEVPSSAIAEPCRLQRRTDELGRIVLAPLFPCELRIMVQPPEGAWSYALSAPLKVGPGLASEVNIDVVVVEGEFTVLDALTAQPFAHRQVRVSPVGGGLVTQAVTDEDGRVRCTLPTGNYQVEDAGDGPWFYMPTGNRVPVKWTALGPVPASVEVQRATPATFPSGR